MKQFKSYQLLIVAMMSVFLDISSAMDCKEVFQRKEEIKECCTAPSILKDDTFDKCMAEAEGNHHEKFFCGSECALKAEGLMNGDELNVDEIEKRIESLEGDWQTTYKGMVHACEQKVTAFKAEIEQRGGPKGPCNPMAGHLIMCMGKNTIQNCPDEFWNDSELCNLVKSGECDRKHKH